MALLAPVWQSAKAKTSSMNELLTAFISTFYGYGNPKSDFWFVGMEEGTGPSWENHVEPRFHAWHERGSAQFEDLRGYHEAIGVPELFNPPVTIQSTWRRLIQTVLAFHGEDATNSQSIASYQANELGRAQGETCLPELLPLPARSTGAWPYAHLADELPFLATRALYREQTLPARIAGLRSLIEQHRPHHLVFYARTYLPHWAAVAAPNAFQPVEPNIQRAQGPGITYWALPHPNARGVSGNPFIRLGELIRGQ